MKDRTLKRMLSVSMLLLTIPALAAGDEFRPIVIPPGLSLVESLRHDKEHFGKLITLIDRSGMRELTARGQSYTLLAPSDEAFAKLPPGEYESLLKDRARVRKFLQGHLLPGKVVFRKLFEPTTTADENKSVTKTLKAVDGARLDIVCNGRHNGVHHPLINNKARVVAPDFEGTNVVIHVIDTVLVWPTAAR